MAAKSSSKEPAKIYVIAGKDNFLVSRECEKLVNSLLAEDEKALSLLSVDADKAVAADVFDELRTLPFLASKRVAVIRGADDFISDNRELLEKYFDNPSSTGILILTVSSWPKTTRLAKKLGDVGELIAFEEMKKGSFANFVIDYAAKEHNRKISYSAAQMLIELVGDDAGRLSSEVDKLAAFEPDSKIISEKGIAQIIGNNRFFDAFNVIEAMSGGKADVAVEKFRRMLSSDKSAEYTVIGAFAYHFRQMFNAKSLLQKKVPVNAVIGQCKIWYDKDGFFKRLEKLSLNQLGKILSELAAIDYGIKTGRVDVQTELETLIVRICLLNAPKQIRA